MAEEYQFGDPFQLKILALYVREPTSSFDFIQPGYFTNAIFVDIARLASQLYQKHSRQEMKLSRDTLLAVVKGYLGRKRADIWPEYKRVVKKLYEDDLSDKVVVMEQAIHFAKEQRFRQALVSAEKSINNKDFSRAIKEFDALKGFGVEQDLGIDYWENVDDPARWTTDRRGVIGTFFLPRLDSLMGGGLGSGELGIILAGGKVGKTTLLGRFGGGAVWQNKTVAIATGELSGEKYRKRIDAMITGIPSYKLSELAKKVESAKPSERVRKELKEAQYRMRMMQYQMKGRLQIKQWPTNKGKISDIENWLDQLEDKRGEKIDILFVDYMRVFKPNDRFEEHRLSIGQVALDLRGIAVERDIPVWTAQQSNRPALKKERLDPTDIAEDISSFWTLDFLLALSQTEQEADKSKDSKGRETGRPQDARIYLIAARDVGRGGTIPVNIWRDTFVVRQKDRRDTAQ